MDQSVELFLGEPIDVHLIPVRFALGSIPMSSQLVSLVRRD